MKMLCGNYIFPRQRTFQALITESGHTGHEISRLNNGSLTTQSALPVMAKIGAMFVGERVALLEEPDGADRVFINGHSWCMSGEPLNSRCAARKGYVPWSGVVSGC